MVPAIVLTAGLGTRLRPLSLVRAKGAMPVAGVPLVRRILASLGANGVRRVVLNLHHLPHTLTALVGDGSDLGLEVRYSWETPVLGSAGGPRRALPLLGAATSLIVNGDTLTDLPLQPLVDTHRASGALVTMAVVPNAAPDKYGGVVVDDRGVVTGFARRGSPERSWHFIGVQAVEPAAFDTVPPDTPWESTALLYPALIAARPGSIRALPVQASFLDIGTAADYLATCLALAGREGGEPTLAAGAAVDSSATVERSVLWDGAVVGPGATLRECVVTDGVRVPADTSWERVTIRPAPEDPCPGERLVGGLAVGALDAQVSR